MFAVGYQHGKKRKKHGDWVFQLTDKMARREKNLRKKMRKRLGTDD